jgi:CRISPR-associated protein Cas1
MRHGGSVVVCDDGYMPVGMMLPLGANALQTQRIRTQLDASLPLRKRLWKGIVQDKIRAQALTLELREGADAGLRALAARVQSGDRQNAESTAAQRYWPRLFGDPLFRRRREAPDQNRLLNYGYAVVRAAVGRSICATGLHASVALHHRHRENAWALADDLIEPYRTLVDDEVAEIVGSFGGDVALDPTIKRRLIGVLHERIYGGPSESRTALDWIGRTGSTRPQRTRRQAAWRRRCLSGSKRAGRSGEVSRSPLLKIQLRSVSEHRRDKELPVKRRGCSLLQPVAVVRCVTLSNHVPATNEAPPANRRGLSTGALGCLIR